MSSINQDIQASHKIISILEQAKNQVEDSVDFHPDLFLVVDSSFKILKGNHKAAEVFSCGIEDLIGISMERIFLKSTWETFIKWVDSLSSDLTPQSAVEFELPINNIDQHKTYFWNVKKVNKIKASGGDVYTIVGRDVTRLRVYEKQLSEIFSNIPIGILSVGLNGLIEGPNSTFVSNVLLEPNCVGKSLREVLFQPIWHDLTLQVREAIESLDNLKTLDLSVFDMIEAMLPKKIFYPASLTCQEQGRWLGLKYQPVGNNGEMNTLLVIIEDRTFQEESEQNDKLNKLKENDRMSKILQISLIDSEILPILVEDISSTIPQAFDSIGKKDSRGFCNFLHGLKGNFRVAGFTELKEITHELESSVLNTEQSNIDWDKIKEKFIFIDKSWKTMNGLIRAIGASDDLVQESDETDGLQILRGIESVDSVFQNVVVKDLIEELREVLSGKSTNRSAEIIAERISLILEQVNQKPLSVLEKMIRMRIDQTAKSLNKKIDVICEWNNCTMGAEAIKALEGSLLHILNNAVDHGIDSEEERLTLGKNPSGLIKIVAEYKGPFLRVTITDDGRGLNPEKIRDKALSKNIINSTEAFRMTPYELIQLIFKPGFSTASQVTEISGRGIGLDAVVSQLEKKNGSVKISHSEVGKGTTFEILLDQGEGWKVTKAAFSVESFYDGLYDQIACFADKYNSKVQWYLNDISESESIFYGDRLKLSIGVSSIIANYINGYSAEIKTKIINGHLEIVVTRNSKIAEKVEDLELQAIESMCKHFIKEHEGELVEDSKSLQIEIKKVFVFSAPVIVDVDPAIDAKTFSNYFRLLDERARKYGIDLRFRRTGSNEKVDCVIVNSQKQTVIPSLFLKHDIKDMDLEILKVVSKIYEKQVG